MKLLDVLYPTSLRIILLSSIHLLLVVQILAQDLGQLDAAHPVQLSGGMTINLGAYSAAGISGRRDPFSYLVLGRLNFNLFGVVDVPIGVSFTQQENGFSQPFNHYGMSPRYKWIQTHVGYRNLTWSPYTLNGHTFLGAGIDLDLPLNAGPKIRLSAMSGRLRRAVDTETALLEDEQPSYRRKGHGLNLQLTDRNNSKNFFTANVFAAKDDPFSIQDLSGYDLESARENVTIGLGGQVSLLDKLVLNGNYGFSALTRDAENEDVSEEKLPFLMELGKVFITPNQSTQFDEAFDVSAGWQIKTWSLKIKYQWIDPGYSSLGSYYFQNDFENITIDGATTLQGGKIRLRASLGQQRNNLEGDKMTRTKRLIGSLNYNHSLTDRMAINGSFSNYSSSLKVVQEELSDTLNYYQINTSLNAGINYVVGSNADRSLYANASYQLGNSRDEYRVHDDNSKFFLASSGYRWRIPHRRLQLKISTNLSKHTDNQIKTTLVGPSVTVGKSFGKKKLNAAYTLGYNWNFMEQQLSYGLWKNRATASYALVGGQRIGLELSVLNKKNVVNTDKSYTEIRGRMSYKMNF